MYSFSGLSRNLFLEGTKYIDKITFAKGEKKKGEHVVRKEDILIRPITLYSRCLNETFFSCTAWKWLIALVAIYNRATIRILSLFRSDLSTGICQIHARHRNAQSRKEQLSAAVSGTAETACRTVRNRAILLPFFLSFLLNRMTIPRLIKTMISKSENF